MSCSRRNRSIWQGVPYPTYAGRRFEWQPDFPAPAHLGLHTAPLSPSRPAGRTRAPERWSPRSEPAPRGLLGSRRRDKCRGRRCTTARTTQSTWGSTASSPACRWGNCYNKWTTSGIVDGQCQLRNSKHSRCLKIVQSPKNSKRHNWIWCTTDDSVTIISDSMKWAHIYKDILRPSVKVTKKCWKQDSTRVIRGIRPNDDNVFLSNLYP